MKPGDTEQPDTGVQVSVLIPPGLQPLCDGQAEVVVVADTVAAALQALVARHPPLSSRLFLPEGGLRPRVNLFLGPRPVSALGGLDAGLQNDDRLLIVPAVAGG